MFDCVLPTRNGRNAYAFTAAGPDAAAQQQVHARPGPDRRPAATATPAAHFTRGAIRHFFFAAEMLGPILVSVHNIRFYQRLMGDSAGRSGRGSSNTFEQSTRDAGWVPPAEPIICRFIEPVPGDSLKNDVRLDRPNVRTIRHPHPPPAAADLDPFWAQPIFPILLIAVVFYLFLYRNKRKTDKSRTDMLYATEARRPDSDHRRDPRDRYRSPR